MKNFGLTDLWLVDPCELSKEAFYMATHAKDVVESATIVATTREAVADLTTVIGTTARKRTSDAHDLYTPREAAQAYPRAGTGLMFGTETSGLSNEDLDYCQAYVKIPTGEFSSLNLAQAVNLICYEFFVTHVDAGKTELPEDIATREDVEDLHDYFLNVADYVGYIQPDARGKVDHMYRRIFDRARLTRREVQALWGLWRQVMWATDHKPRTNKNENGDTV